MGKASPKRNTSKKAPPRKTVQRFTWRGVEMSVTHSPNYISAGWTHLELRVIRPKSKPVPITTTGYLSHFLDEDDLEAAGGSSAPGSNGKGKQGLPHALAKWQQLDLFISSAGAGNRPRRCSNCVCEGVCRDWGGFCGAG